LYHSVVFLAEHDNLLKGGVFAILIWFLWFKNNHSSFEKRERIIATLISVFFVMVITLGIAGLCPFRVRPFLNPEFVFISPDSTASYISKLSSFPSDHAALFVSISTGFFFVSRKTGLFALLYTVIFILFPRLYLGYHYPTDLIVGSLIGACITILFNRSKAILLLISKQIMPSIEKYPSFFYSILFLVTYEIADLFAGSRNILSFLYSFYK
jgi:undecaprenyl-diphosphatase